MVPAGNALGVLSKKAHIPPLKISGIKRRNGFSGMRLYDMVCRVPENRYNAVDEALYETIKVDLTSPKNYGILYAI